MMWRMLASRCVVYCRLCAPVLTPSQVYTLEKVLKIKRDAGTNMDFLAEVMKVGSNVCSLHTAQLTLGRRWTNGPASCSGRHLLRP